MASKIRVLDDITINKIAAGEVIENPSSVVKELIENSLDAGSTEIIIEIQAGGRRLIRVSDNGIGMSKDDALLSLERHATSKLKHIDDFDHLLSMGFRGEALPSIAVISKFCLLTNDCDQLSKGTLIKVDGGKLNYCDAAARMKGITVEVSDLFFNVPVRKKFQKSPSFDEIDILKTVQKEALAYPEIKFQLLINQKAQFLDGPSTFRDRLKLIFGNEILSLLIPLEKNEEEYRLSGFISKPSAHKQNKATQYLFINKRPVFSSLLSYFVKEAFATYIPIGRHPQFFLSIDLPPGDVDVNVHPQKKEIRLRNESFLKRLIYIAVQEALGKERTPSLHEWAESFSPQLFPWEQMETVSLPIETTNVSKSHDPVLFQKEQKPIPKVLTTIKGYIVTESNDHDGITLVDQGRAHSRILFEKMEKETSFSEEKEALLIPYMIELSQADILLLKAHLPKLNAMGFEIREFAPGTFAIDAYPLLFKKESLSELIHSFLKDIQQLKEDSFYEQAIKSRLAEKSASCSITSERCLSLDEAQKLVFDLMLCEHPYESPLGKPTVVKLNKDNLARHFQK